MNESKTNSDLDKVTYYQVFVLILSIIGFIIRLFISVIEITSGTGLVLYLGNMFSYFTIQTNLLVLFWLAIALIYRNHDKRPKIMHPIIHGAICLYISGTFVIFAIFLSPYYQPTGIEAISNILMHYIVPVAFIVEWFITESNTEYKYSYLPYYTIYPFGYVIFTAIRGAFTGFYPYYFFDLSMITIIDLAINVFLLFVLFTIMGSIYIAINRRLYKSKEE